MTRITPHREEPYLIPASSRRDLGARIKWICQTLRVAALLWIAWIMVFFAYQLSNKERVLQSMGKVLSVDLSNVSEARYAIALIAAMVGVAAGIAVVVCLWRLAGVYLAGRVFTVDAALWLRRTALALLVWALLGVLTRAMAYSILIGHVLPLAGYYLLPGDLLRTMLGGFLIALAYIFQAAAEMAEDHAAIV